MERNPEQLAQARERMTRTAKGLVAVLGPDDAIATLAGALTRVLLDMNGRERAVEYLRMLAVELDVDEQAPPAPPFGVN